MNESSPMILKFGPGLRLTDLAFWKLCAANPELRLERTARGELEIMPPGGSGTGGRNATLTVRLGRWAEETGLGKVFDSSAGFILPNGATRSPDTSWIASDRWNALSAEEKATFAPICPDFVVELRSKTDDKKKLRKQTREFIAQGARLGWLLDPFDDEALVYRPGRRAEDDQEPENSLRRRRAAGVRARPEWDFVRMRGRRLSRRDPGNARTATTLIDSSSGTRQEDCKVPPV